MSHATKQELIIGLRTYSGIQQEAWSALYIIKGKQAEYIKMYLHKTFLHKPQVYERKLIRSQQFLLMKDKDMIFPRLLEGHILLTSTA